MGREVEKTLGGRCGAPFGASREGRETLTIGRGTGLTPTPEPPFAGELFVEVRTREAEGGRGGRS